MTKGKWFGVAAALLLIGIPLAAQQPAPVELRSIAHARTLPLNSYIGSMHAKPNPAMPVFPWHRPQSAKPGGSSGGSSGGAGSSTDPDLQTSYGTSTLSTPFFFPGIGFDGALPPDTNLSVGKTLVGTTPVVQIVQIVNVEFDVYNSSGGELLAGGAAPIHTIFAALGSNNLCATTDGGDPIALFDKLDKRWLISQLAYNVNIYGVPFDFHFCLAISTGSDATGSYDVYDIPFGQNILPDYPKLAVWSDGIYFSANIFTVTGSLIPHFKFTGAQACRTPRPLPSPSSPQTSFAITFTCTLGGNTAIYNILPADLEGASTTGAPPGDYYLQFLASSGVGNTLRLYQFSSGALNTIANLTVGTYQEACAGGTCIPQGGTTQQLDSLADRLMYRLSYRNYGTFQQMVVNHAVQISSSNNQTGIRWYSVCNKSGSFAVCQQSTFSPDAGLSSGLYRWMASIAQDQKGNIAMGYSTSSANAYPGVAVTGQAAGATVPSMEQELSLNVSTLPGGQGWQDFFSRWGDYSSISLDASDDCTFWYTTEYMQAPNIFGLNFIWETVIGSFKLACP